MDQADTRMSFFEHLGELRLRIILSIVAIGVGFLATFYFSEQIIDFLAEPVHAKGVKLVFLSAVEPFWTNMKVAMISGFFLVLPFVLYQVWAFVSPGLHPHERRYAVPFVVIGTLFFAIGVTFAQLVIKRYAIKFLLEFKTAGLTPTLSVGRYVDLILKLTIAFGLVFELPLAITVASRMGLVTPEFLAKNRKYAVLLSFVAAAILTPTPDWFNQTLMAGPIIILYEVGILAARIFGRKRTAAPTSGERK